MNKCIAQNGKNIPKDHMAYFGLCNFLNILRLIFAGTPFIPSVWWKSEITKLNMFVVCTMFNSTFIGSGLYTDLCYYILLRFLSIFSLSMVIAWTHFAETPEAEILFPLILQFVHIFAQIDMDYGFTLKS